MVKKSRSIYIIGSIIIGLAAIFLVYFLLIVTGVIMVKNENLIITSGKIEVAYTGEKVTCESYEILDGELSEGHSIEAIYTGNLTNVGVTSNSWDFKIVDSLGVDVTENYIVKKLEGTITVNKRKLQIQATSKEQVYNGKPLTAETVGYKIVGGELVESHNIEVTPYGEITGVGTTDANLYYTIYDQNKNIVTGNYDVEVIPGVLEVKPVSITVSSEDAHKTYDGKPLTHDKCEIKDGNLIDYTGDGLPDHKLVTIPTGTITDIGETKNTFKCEIIDINTEEVVTDNYDINYVYGKLTVYTDEMVFIGENHDLTYNAKVIDTTKFKVNPSEETQKMLDDFGYSYEITYDENLAEIKDACAEKILYKVIITDKDGKVITDYCKIERIYGILTVSKFPIIIKSVEDKEAVYTGKPYYTEDTPFEKIIMNAPTITETGETIKLSKYHLDLIEASQYQNIVKVDIVDANNEVVTDNYDIKYEYGSIFINKKVLRFESDSIEQLYTSFDQTVTTNGYENSELNEGHQLSSQDVTYTVTDYMEAIKEGKTILNAPKEIKIIDQATNNDVTENYELNFDACGEIIIQTKLIIASKSNPLKTYDGLDYHYNVASLTLYEGDATESLDELTAAEGTNVLDLPFLNDHKVVIEFDTHDDFINVGETPNGFKYQVLHGDTDVSAMFDITKVIGILSISPCYVVISTNNVEKEYIQDVVQSGKDKGIAVNTGSSPNVSKVNLATTQEKVLLGVENKEQNYIEFSKDWTGITKGFVVNRPLSYQILTKDGKVQSFVKHDGITNANDITANYIVKEEFGYLTIYVDDFDLNYAVDSIAITNSQIFEMFPDGFTMQDLVDLGATSGYVPVDDDSDYIVTSVSYYIDGVLDGVITKEGNYKVTIKVTVELAPNASPDAIQKPSIGYYDGYINVDFGV